MPEIEQDAHNNLSAGTEYPALDERSDTGARRVDLVNSPLNELLREYKMFLPSGAYYLIGKIKDEELADVEEIFVPFPGSLYQDEEFVTFAFFEKGCPPADLVQKGYHSWRAQFPFSHDVSSTSPEFQDLLSYYIRVQLSRIIT